VEIGRRVIFQVTGTMPEDDGELPYPPLRQHN
jgi:hypothetical protein